MVKGGHFTEEQKQKLRDEWKIKYANGYVNPTKGLSRTEETRRKISLGRAGKPLSQKHKDALSESHKGKIRSEAARQKQGETLRQKYANGYVNPRQGKHNTEEHRRKLILSNLGRHPNEETKRKIGLANKLWPHLSGEKHYNWMGGISFEPYPLGWTRTFKEQIRQRDGYRCQLCGVLEEDCVGSLHVHHIDYDKANIRPENLISLCHSCHSKTIYNRLWWKELFSRIMASPFLKADYLLRKFYVQKWICSFIASRREVLRGE